MSGPAACQFWVSGQGAAISGQEESLHLLENRYKPVLLQENLPENKTASDHSLAKIRQSLKGFTAHRCNQIPGRSGTFWEQESYDHYIRNQEEDHRIISYVLNNPVKAGLVTN